MRDKEVFVAILALGVGGWFLMRKPTSLHVLSGTKPIAKLNSGTKTPALAGVDNRPIPNKITLPAIIPAPKEKVTEVLAQTLLITASPQRMPLGRPVHGEVRVTADTGNAADSFIANSSAGCSNGPRYTIEAGQSQNIKVTELSKLWFFGTTADYLSIICEIEVAVNEASQ